MQTLTMRRNTTAHSAPVTSVALSKTGTLLATSSYDGTTIIWDTHDPVAPRKISTISHRRLVNAATWNPYRDRVLATASADKTVATWDLSREASPQLIGVVGRHTDDINSVAWMPDGERFACVSEDGRASLWNSTSSTYQGLVASHSAHCMMVDISPRGLVATVGEDGLVSVNDLDAGDVSERMYEGSVEGCSWSNAGDRLAIARDDGSVDVLDEGLGLLVSAKIASSAVRSVAWSDDDDLLVIGAYDGAVHLMDDKGRVIRSVTDGRFWPRSVSVSGDVVAVGSFWSGPHLLDLMSLDTLSGPAEPTHGVNAVVADAAENEVLLGSDSGLVVSVPIDASPTLLSKLVAVRGITSSIILSLARDNVRAWAGTYAGEIISVEDPEKRSVNLGAPVPALISVRGSLVAGTYNGELVELDKTTLSELRRYAAHEGSIKSLASLPGTDRFLAASTDRTVSIGDFDNRRTLWEHGNLVNAVAINAEGSVVASASRDHTVKVGRIAADGSLIDPVLTLLGADESVKAVAVLGNAKAPVVIAGSYDFGLYAWNVDWDDGYEVLRTGTLVKMLGQGVSAIISSGENVVIAVGWDGSLVFLQLDNGEIVEVADHSIPALVAGFDDFLKSSE